MVIGRLRARSHRRGRRSGAARDRGARSRASIRPSTRAGPPTSIGLQAQVTGKARPVLLLLAGAIASVLLIACANVANLKLGQVLARRTELAVRAALGASRGRILRQMVVEGLVLAAVGGGLGILAAVLGVRALVHAQVRQIPRLAGGRRRPSRAGVRARWSPRWPAWSSDSRRRWRCGRGSLRQPLSRRGGEGASAPAGPDPARRPGLDPGGAQPHAADRGRTDGALAGQAAVGASRVRSPTSVLTVQLSLPSDAYGSPEKRAAFYEELTRRIGGTAGSRERGAGELPSAARHHARHLGAHRRAGRAAARVRHRSPKSTPSTRATSPPCARRWCRDAGSPTPIASGAPNVVLINKAFAEQLLKGSPPIGQRIRVNMAEPDSVLEIVGHRGRHAARGARRRSPARRCSIPSCRDLRPT